MRRRSSRAGCVESGAQLHSTTPAPTTEGPLRTNEAEAIMLKRLPDKMGTGLHGSIPPSRYWAYYTWQEIDAIAKHDRNATAVINVGAVEQHGPHLPLITDTLVGMELL